MIGGMMQGKALTDVRVLDLTQSLGYASKLFADLGAVEGLAAVVDRGDGDVAGLARRPAR